MRERALCPLPFLFPRYHAAESGDGFVHLLCRDVQMGHRTHRVPPERHHLHPHRVGGGEDSVGR